MKPRFQKGDRVNHPEFGKGTVDEPDWLPGVGEYIVCLVLFDKEVSRLLHAIAIDQDELQREGDF